MPDSTAIKLEGSVEAVVYQNEENGYTVLKFRTQDRVVSAVGTLPEVFAGESLVLTGAWTTHRTYGEQFATELFERRAPKGADALFAFLSSGAVKNVGAKTAKDIIEKFGDAALNIIENKPERLSEIRGITPLRAQKIAESYRRRAGLARLIEALAEFGVKPDVAVRLYADYRDEAIDAVRENPYIMTAEHIGAAFQVCDEMALGLGFDSDNPLRVEAAVIFEIIHNLGNGHTFLPRNKLIEATSQFIGVDGEAADDALFSLEERGRLIEENIDGIDAVYLDYMAEAERYAAARLLEMAAKPVKTREIDGDFLTEIEAEQGIVYAPAQRKAVEMAATCSVMLLTGGPGTGKTTTLRAILALFDKFGWKTLLAAPTGRAAKRMGDVTGHDAATIHRLLGAVPGAEGELEFERDDNNPLRADAVIVDESSMIDINLMHALLSALPPSCRFIMLGDADQLPSVGPGNVFADIIKSDVIPAVSLTQIFRQAEESGIVSSAHKINRGELPDLKQKYTDFFFMSRGTAERIAETVAELCAERLPKNMKIPPEQIQVITLSHKTAAGTAALNTALREALNPPLPGKVSIMRGERIFRVGDRVMQNKNNYDIMWEAGREVGAGIFNGDIGTITGIDLKNETVTVNFDDRTADYTYSDLIELEPAFAMTVHKSQGNEYRAVVLALCPGVQRLLTRSILYTAVTRAKELLIVVGDTGTLEAMVKSGNRRRRYSGLKARLERGV